MSKKLSRRDLLKASLSASTLGVIANPLSFIVETIGMGVLNEAHAQTSGSLMNFVSIHIGGGLDRMVFDSMLNPLDDCEMSNNNGVRTRFHVDGSNNVTTSYATTKVGPIEKQYNFPWLWNSMLPKADGGSVSMKDLAQNMLTIRGFKSVVGDGHPVNAPLTIRPTNGKSSIHGMVAENANFLFPAIMRGDHNYASTGGKLPNSLSASSTALNDLFSVYHLSDLNVITDTDVESAVDNFIQKVKSRFTSSNPNMDILYKNREKILQFSKESVEEIKAELPGRISVYRTLIQRVANARAGGLGLVGLDAQDLKANGSDTLWRLKSNLYQSIDYLDRFDHDITARCADARNENLAISFALVESLLLNGYSNNFNISTTLMERFYRFTNPGSGQLQTTGSSFVIDRHETSINTALFFYSKGYQMFSACLYHFIDVLRHNNKFDDTLIWLTSEFNRSPRGDATGADHGYDNQVESFWSGSILGPQVGGNIRINSNYSPDRYPGTWGLAAPLGSSYGNLVPTNRNINTSILTMLKIEPFLNNPPLVQWQNGKIVLTTGRPYNV